MKKEITQNKEFRAMADSIAKYIEGRGGSAIVIGGVKVGKEFGALRYNYFIKIAITGKMPKSK